MVRVTPLGDVGSGYETIAPVAPRQSLLSGARIVVNGGSVSLYTPRVQFMANLCEPGAYKVARLIAKSPAGGTPWSCLRRIPGETRPPHHLVVRRLL